MSEENQDTTATTTETTAPAADTQTAPATTDTGDVELTPSFGQETKTEDTAPEKAEGEGSEQKAEETKEEKPEQTIEDYKGAFQLDKSLFPEGANQQFDSRVIDALAPLMKEKGITSEVANELANAVVKAQLEVQREENRTRNELFRSQEQDMHRTYSQRDLDAISAAAYRRFPKGSSMDFMFRHSELGVDPHLLRWLFEDSQSHKTDAGAGLAAGSGSTDLGDGNDEKGMSKIW